MDRYYFLCNVPVKSLLLFLCFHIDFLSYVICILFVMTRLCVSCALQQNQENCKIVNNSIDLNATKYDKISEILHCPLTVNVEYKVIF